MAHEGVEELELAPGQLELAPATARRAPRGVDRHVGDLHRQEPRLVRAAQQGMQPGDQLLQRERLDHVVVGARLQPTDSIVDLVARRQHADRDLRALRSQPGGHGHPVQVGHGHVEHEHLRLLLVDRLERLLPAARRTNREALEREGALEGGADGRVVVYDEDRGPVVSRPRGHPSRGTHVARRRAAHRGWAEAETHVQAASEPPRPASEPVRSRA